MAITESWLTDRDSDADLSLDGFDAPVRLDRVLVRERLCTKDVELVAVSLRPPYFPNYLL